jgi:hypothetical protein
MIFMNEITFERPAQIVRERMSAVLQILTTMQGMNPSGNRDVTRLLGAAGEDAEQALTLIRMVRAEL